RGEGLARGLDGFEQDDQIAVRMPLRTARLRHVPIEKKLHRLAPPLVGDDQCRNTWLARRSSAEMLQRSPVDRRLRASVGLKAGLDLEHDGGRVLEIKHRDAPHLPVNIARMAKNSHLRLRRRIMR